MMVEMDDLFERNLDFFKDLNPALHERLINFKPLSTLVFDDENDPDIHFQGMDFYGLGAKKYVERQLQKFWYDPSVITLAPISSSSVDSEGGAVLYNMLKHAQGQGITFNESRTTHQAFHLVVLGVGLGQHIEPLIEEVWPRNLILIEPNFEFLYQSLFVMDWQEVFGGIIEDGGNVHLLTDSDTEILITELRRIYTKFGQACFDGLTAYTHYSNPAFDAVVAFLATEGDILFSGLGFFEDELNMIANTYNNLKSGQEKVFYANLTPKEFPVFVVGSGPSLDGALETIKTNAHKAIVISCGTGLLPLLRSGVKPDFHIELERSKFQMEIPAVVAQEFDLSDICLVGTTTLVPGVKSVFDKRIFYFRHMLSSFPAFSGDTYNCLRFPSPTVGNAGTSFAQDSGFRKIYLFGIDLGFVDPDAHHSSHTVYHQKGEKYEFTDAQWDRTVRGNFGGSVKSTHVLQWSRDTLEVSMAQSSLGHIYYNCSDGALIEGAVPLLPEFVELPDPPEAKETFVERIIGGFPVYSRENFDAHWQDGQIIKSMREVGDQVIEAIRSNSDLNSKKYISEVFKIVKPLVFEQPELMVLRGALFQVLLVGEYYLDRIEQADKKAEFMNYLCDEYCRAVDSMCEETAVEFTSLEKTGKLLNRETVWG